MNSLKRDRLLTFTPPKLNKSDMAIHKEMWRIMAQNTFKWEELLELKEAVYAVALLVCNPVLKDQECNSEGYEYIDNMQHSLGLLRCIKKIIYSKVMMTPTWYITI